MLVWRSIFGILYICKSPNKEFIVRSRKTHTFPTIFHLENPMQDSPQPSEQEWWVPSRAECNYESKFHKWSHSNGRFHCHYRFQYVLAAATSIATKNNEETITYLNQGQSYEIKLKKLGDLTAYRGKILKVNSSPVYNWMELQKILI